MVCQHLSTVGDEKKQYLVFDRREMDFPASRFHPPLFIVHNKIPVLKYCVLIRYATLFSPKCCPYSCQQFPHIEGFCNIIICPGVKRTDLFLFFLSCGHNDHWCICNLPDTFDHFHAVTIGKPQIQNHQIRMIGIKEADCLFYCPCCPQNIFFLFQTHLQKMYDIFVVLDNQYCIFAFHSPMSPLLSLRSARK